MRSFESVKNALRVKGVTFDEVLFTDTAVSARVTDTSMGKNYDPLHAIKTLIVSCKDGFKAVILRGSDKIDQAKLKAVVGKWSVLDSATLGTKFDYQPGTICPLDLDLPVLIDQDALNIEIWSMGAGAVDKGVNVKVEEALKHLVGYQIVPIRQEKI